MGRNARRTVARRAPAEVDPFEALLADDAPEVEPRREPFCYRDRFDVGEAGPIRLDCPHPEHVDLARAMDAEVRAAGFVNWLDYHAHRIVKELHG